MIQNHILKVIERAVNSAPLTLLSLSPVILKEINSYLPYSVGIEIECSFKNSIEAELKTFKDIPFIMKDTSGYSEMRVRIPNGVKGLVCLYLIAERLKGICELNPLSGIHYHIDATHSYDSIKEQTSEERKYILDEIDKNWDNKGDYNSRKIGEGHNWIRMNSHYRTFEFRVGEMTFDYELLIKRIRHATKMMSYLNSNRKIADPDIPVITKEEIKEVLNFYKTSLILSSNARKIAELEKKLDKLREKTIETFTEEEQNKILNNRTVKINL